LLEIFFQALDLNGDDYLDTTELHKWHKLLSHEHHSSLLTQKIFHLLQLNSYIFHDSQKLTKEEFINIFLLKKIKLVEIETLFIDLLSCQIISTAETERYKDMDKRIEKKSVIRMD